MWYQPQGGSFQSATTSSEGSYTITGLEPATTFTVVMNAQTQLGYGSFCCTPTVTATTHNGEAPSDACRGSQPAHDSLLHSVCVSCYRTAVQHACHLYCTSEVHNHSFVTQCYYIDVSAAYLTNVYEGQRECHYSLIAMFISYSARL